jgi:multimeric flavodoxin WrbA
VKTVAICGSPRENGNTEHYLRIVLDELSQQGIETEFVSLRDKTIQPCRGCYQCLTAGCCVIKDDFAAVFDKMKEADGILLGSPVYVARPTSLMSAFLERATFSGRAAGQVLAGKVGGPVVVARRTGQAMASAELLLWFFINDIVVPGSSYWNIGVAGARGARDAENDLEGADTMKKFAANMVRVMTALDKFGGDQAKADRNVLFYLKPDDGK